MARWLIQRLNHFKGFFRAVIFAACGNLDAGDELVRFGRINEGCSRDAAEGGASDAECGAGFKDCDHIELLLSICHVTGTVCLCILLAVAAGCLKVPVAHAEFDLCSHAGLFIFCDAVVGLAHDNAASASRKFIELFDALDFRGLGEYLANVAVLLRVHDCTHEPLAKNWHPFVGAAFGVFSRDGHGR